MCEFFSHLVEGRVILCVLIFGILSGCVHRPCDKQNRIVDNQKIIDGIILIGNQ